MLGHHHVCRVQKDQVLSLHKVTYTNTTRGPFSVLWRWSSPTQGKRNPEGLCVNTDCKVPAPEFLTQQAWGRAWELVFSHIPRWCCCFMSGGHTWRTTVSFRYSFFFFWLHHLACNILAPQPEIKLVSPSVEAQSPNHWTAIKVPLPLLRWKGLRTRREVDLQFCSHL